MRQGLPWEDRKKKKKQKQTHIHVSILLTSNMRQLYDNSFNWIALCFQSILISFSLQNQTEWVRRDLIISISILQKNKLRQSCWMTLLKTTNISKEEVSFRFPGTFTIKWNCYCLKKLPEKFYMAFIEESRFFFKIFIFSIIVDLQCSVNFCYTAKWPSHTYIYILFLTYPPSCSITSD